MPDIAAPPDQPIAPPAGPGSRSGPTRTRLIEAAQSALIEGGGQAEISAIAARAGLSAGLAYHHFGSKDGLITEVVVAFYARYEAIMSAHYAGATWSAREIQRTRAAVHFLVEHPFTATLYGPLGRSSEVVNAESACMADLIDLGAHTIAQGQAGGDLPRQSDPALAAAFVLGGMRQAVTEAIMSERKPDPAALAESVWILIASSLGLRVGSKA